MAVTIDVSYPVDDPSEPCFDAATAKLLDEIVRRAEAGNVEYLETVGEVFVATKHAG